MDKQNEDEWDIVIDQSNGLFDLKLKQVWEYRDLLVLFVRRDFVSFYKQTILGPLWFFVQPIFTTIIYVFLFGKLAKLSTDGLPAPLFYLAGITVWSYFSETLLKISGVLRDNAGIFGKVYFPRLIMPLSIILSSLFKFGVQLLLLVITMVYFALTEGGVSVPWQVIFFPLLILVTALQSLGLGMIVAALATKYRDLAMLLGFGLQLLMYLTPVVFPLSSVAGTFKLIVASNPMTAIVESIRYCLLGTGTVEVAGLAYSIFITIVLFLLGTLFYNKAEKSFVDTV